MERTFVIFNVSEIGSVDFSEVLETSADTLRLSVDGTKTFVKWDGVSVPVCVESLTTKSPYYSYEEMLAILSNEEWVNSSMIP
jgi:hypothetical protein